VTRPTVHQCDVLLLLQHIVIMTTCS